MSNRSTSIRVALPFFIWLVLTIAIGVLFWSGATESQRGVALRTIGLGIASAMIAIPLGVLIAWSCRGTGLLSRILLVCTIASLLVPLFIQVSGWDAAFGKLGWLTSTKGQILVPLVSGWSAAIWIHGVAAAPQVAVIVLIGLNISRPVYEEQALMDSTPFGVFWHVAVPRIWPLIWLSGVWVVLVCAREIAVTDLYQIGTLAEQVYLGYSLGLTSIAGNWTPEQLAEAGSVSQFLAVVLISWLAMSAFLLFFSVTGLEYESRGYEPVHYSSGRWVRSASSALLIVGLTLVPIGNTFIRASFHVRPVNGVPTQGYSIEQLFRSLRRACVDYQDEFVWSFLIAFTSATLIIGLAIVLAFLSQRSRLARIAFAGSLAVCCALPGPSIGTGIASIMGGVQHEGLNWFYNYTIGAPVLANMIFCWPLGALVVWFVFRKSPQSVLESSQLDGSGAMSRLLRFGVLGNRYAIGGCWLITFTFCFGELSASQIVRPAGIDTVPRKMLGDLHAGVNELTAGITIVTASAVILVTLLGWWLIRLNRRTNGRQ